MKKTLIALSAVAGLALTAQGATTITTGADYILAGYSDFNGTSSVLTQGKLKTNTDANISGSWESDTDGNITLTTEGIGLRNGQAGIVAFVLDTALLTENSFTSIFSYNLGSSAPYFGLAINSDSSELVGTWASNTESYSSDALSTANAVDNEGNKFDFVYGKKYAVVFDTNNKASNIVIQEVGSDTAYTATNTDLHGVGNTNNKLTISADAIDAIVMLYIYNDRSTGWSSTLVGELATAAIPEPATASLSLLGLAALMIRRRR